MRILFVAMSNSIHTAGWISQLEGLGWEIALFPSIDLGLVHSKLRDVTVYHSFYGENGAHPSVKQIGVRIRNMPYWNVAIPTFFDRFKPNWWNKFREWQLKKTILSFQPDIVHSMEIQHGAYLVLNVRDKWEGKFPHWALSNWGSDIYHFGKQEKHKEPIRRCLRHADSYWCETQRDMDLGLKFGFRGKQMPVTLVSGGYDIEEAQEYKQFPVSCRKTIMVKGQDDWAGRGLVALEAVRLCAKDLRGYEIIVHSLNRNDRVYQRINEIREDTGLWFTILERHMPRVELLRCYARARASLWCSVSDGIGRSLIDAMLMGAFPLHSAHGATEEWIQEGITGFIVPPDDPYYVATKLRAALHDNKLVDQAAGLNLRAVQPRVDEQIIRPRVIKCYEEAL